MNAYKLPSETLEAIRTDVPDAVKKFFNLEEVNLQKQMDAPFLLSESAGEIARFFNRIIKLDVIDAALSLADKKKRDNTRDRKIIEEEIAGLEKELERFNWIESAESLTDKAQKIQDRKDQFETDLESLEASLRVYEAANERIQKASRFVNAEDSLQRAEKLSEKLKEAQSELETLEKSLESYNYHENKLKTLPDTEKAAKILPEIEKINAEIEKTREKADSLTILKNRFEDSKEIAQERTKSIQDLTSRLPDVCPACGAPIRKDNV
jgi:DNA repair exonuclease SbcCD ATPase subunit